MDLELCIYCKNFFLRATLLKHQKTAKYCKKIQNKIKPETVSSDRIFLYECYYCDNYFELSQLEEHEKTHQTKENTKAVSETLKKSNNLNSSDESFGIVYLIKTENSTLKTRMYKFGMSNKVNLSRLKTYKKPEIISIRRVKNPFGVESKIKKMFINKFGKPDVGYEWYSLKYDINLMESVFNSCCDLYGGNSYKLNHDLSIKTSQPKIDQKYVKTCHLTENKLETLNKYNASTNVTMEEYNKIKIEHIMLNERLAFEKKLYETAKDELERTRTELETYKREILNIAKDSNTNAVNLLKDTFTAVNNLHSFCVKNDYNRLNMPIVERLYHLITKESSDIVNFLKSGKESPFINKLSSTISSEFYVDNLNTNSQEESI